MAGTHYVPPHGWRGTTHPGYSRRNRPKSKVRRIAKKPVRNLYSVTDKYGRFMGYKHVIKRR